MGITKVIQLTTSDALELFARKIPNATKMLVDYGRDSLLIQFDNIHAKEYSISEIKHQTESAAKLRGVTIEWR
jgi:hypothetical protein